MGRKKKEVKQVRVRRTKAQLLIVRVEQSIETLKVLKKQLKKLKKEGVL
jgi:uncharacterized protein Veg